jgi:Ricin-type beta-trefoil lectin domain-like
MRDDLLYWATKLDPLATSVRQPSPAPLAAGRAVMPRRAPHDAKTKRRRRPAVLGGLLVIVLSLLTAVVVLRGGSPAIDPAASGPTNKLSPSPAPARSTDAALTAKAGRSPPGVTASTRTVRQVAHNAPSQSPSPEGGGQNRTPTTTSTIHDRYLRNVVTGLCADLSGGTGAGLDAPVIHHQCIVAAGDSQKWDLVYRTTADNNDYYWIKNRGTGLCMDLPGFGPVPASTEVRQYTCGDNDNQHWSRVWRGSGYWVINRNTGLCLDVAGSPPAWPRQDYPLTIWECSDSDDHGWLFAA